MKTHEFADALRQLARILEQSPNLELNRVRLSSPKSAINSNSQIAVNLATLAELAHIDKGQWLDFIKEHGFPITPRPRDATRDILGKVLTYLEENPDARKQLRETATKRASETSPELMRAFAYLLKDMPTGE